MPERIEGNLTIPSNETMVFRDASVVIEGHLIVLGTLMLINSTLTIEGIYIASDNTNMSVLLSGAIIMTDGDKGTASVSSILGEDDPVIIKGYGPSPYILCMNSKLINVHLLDVELDAYGSVIGSCTILEGILNITYSMIVNSTLTDPDFWSVFDNSTMVRSKVLLTEGGPRFSRVTVLDSIAPFVIDSGHLHFVDCTFVNNTRTVSFNNGCDISVTNSRIEDNRAFLHCMDGESAPSTSIRIEGCNIWNSTLNLYHTSTRVSDCSFFNSSSLVRPGTGTISDCFFMGSNKAIEEAKGTTIVRCRFDGCEVAIDRSERCLIYHNAFLINRFYFIVNHPSNRWNDSKEGNYHIYYNGLDDGSGFRRADDGIGDTNIPFLGVDHYPLMMDHYWDMPTIPSISTDYINGSADVTVLVQGPQGMRTIIQDSTSFDFKDNLRTFSIIGRVLVVPDCINGTHYFRARSYSELGSRGWSLPISQKVDQRPLPPVIEEVTAPEEGGSIIITWRYVGDDVRKVWIYYNEVNESSGVSRVVDHPANSIKLEGLKNNRTYRIQLFTQDVAGLGSLNAAVVFARPMDVLPPDPPRNLQARAIDNTTVILSWFPPSAQDISEYLVIRRKSDEDDFSIIARLTKERLSYDDRNLRDNTTYYYGVIAVDDDGPLSDMAGPVKVRTLHVNNPPFMIGGEVILRGVEDESSIEIDIFSRFRDLDGDRINIEITESFPFPSRIDRPFLRVTPEKDQAGDGYVQLKVDDGEEAVYYLIWVIIEHRPDPPIIEAIVSPRNGSSHLPGAPLQLSAVIWDPDIPYGDVLSVEWRSDRDGLISFNNASLAQGIAYLSPGLHVITLIVTDSTGSNVSATSTIAVSIWGFDDMPWSISINDQGTYTTDGGFQVMIDLANGGPLLLTFRCTITVNDRDRNASYDRVLVLSPGTNGSVLIKESELGNRPEALYVTATVKAETFNGTFAGEAQRSMPIDRFRPAGSGKDVERTFIVVGIATVSMVLIAFIAVLYLLRKKYKDDPESEPYAR